MIEFPVDMVTFIEKNVSRKSCESSKSDLVV